LPGGLRWWRPANVGDQLAGLNIQCTGKPDDGVELWHFPSGLKMANLRSIYGTQCASRSWVMSAACRASRSFFPVGRGHFLAEVIGRHIGIVSRRGRFVYGLAWNGALVSASVTTPEIEPAAATLAGK
jgi:hypothetical protein